jgi:ribonuclease G
VQIIKEPISTKGPRISSELSIAGRYLVLVPFSNRISVSQKIDSNEEKERLKRLVKSIAPKGFGVIIRTVAKGKKVAELDKDLQTLHDRWIAMCKKLHRATYPSKVLDEMNKSSLILRDLFNDTFTSIVVDDETLYYQLKEYVQEIAPKQESIVKLHKDESPIFEKFGIERQIKTSFGQNVSMAKGAYLVIEHTEALHVVDVNSGNRSSKSNNQEDTALEVNLIAATEIARQLRLRDMGGIIVVDFIDLGSAENRKKLFDHLRDEMKDDRAKHKILPPSKFGLIQITRQRVRPEMTIKTREKNPNNRNGAEIEAPILIVNKIAEDLELILKKGHKNVRLNAHPFIAAFLNKGFYSFRNKWIWKYKQWIKINPRDAYTYLEYHFTDKNGKNINL